MDRVAGLSAPEISVRHGGRTQRRLRSIFYRESGDRLWRREGADRDSTCHPRPVRRRGSRRGGGLGAHCVSTRCGRNSVAGEIRPRCPTRAAGLNPPSRLSAPSGTNWRYEVLVDASAVYRTTTCVGVSLHSVQRHRGPVQRKHPKCNGNAFPTGAGWLLPPVARGWAGVPHVLRPGALHGEAHRVFGEVPDELPLLGIRRPGHRTEKPPSLDLDMSDDRDALALVEHVPDAPLWRSLQLRHRSPVLHHPVTIRKAADNRTVTPEPVECAL